MLLSGALLSVSGCGHPDKSGQGVTAARMAEIENLQGYALSVCLAQSYPEQKVAADAAAAASGYLEIGTLPIEAYERVRELAERARKRDYASKHDADLSVMRCADFALGNEVRAAATAAVITVPDAS